jgi:hypothetical protein
MGLVTCTQCATQFSDDEFLCPCCGTCVIPQATKVQQQKFIDAEVGIMKKPVAWGTGIGFGIGIVVGLVVVGLGVLPGSTATVVLAVPVALRSGIARRACRRSGRPGPATATIKASVCVEVPNNPVS